LDVPSRRWSLVQTLEGEKAQWEESIVITGEVNPLMILLLRLAHGLVALLLMASIGVIYYSAASHTHGIWLLLAMVALVAEGIVVALNKGNCPFSHLSTKYGDTKTFFELFLPKPIARQMFKINGVIIAVGSVYLVVSLSS
jgi:hypothetical protein